MNTSQSYKLIKKAESILDMINTVRKRKQKAEADLNIFRSSTDIFSPLLLFKSEGDFTRSIKLDNELLKKLYRMYTNNLLNMIAQVETVETETFIAHLEKDLV